MIKACIFDMDGLMIDSERVTEQAYFEVSPEFGLTMTHEIYSRLIARSAADGERILQEFFPGADIGALRRRAAENMEAHYRAEGIPVKEGLFELFRYLEEKGIGRLVATSTGRERAEDILRRTGIFAHLDGGVFGDEVTHSKPDPEIFLKALAKTGAQKQEVLILEDSHYGIQAANRAGIPVIMIPDLLAPAPAYRPEAVLKSLLLVPEYLVKREKGNPQINC